jgi:uncharacterized damage-inducible protein DinB
MNISVNDLMEYTEWEREKWQKWFQRQSEQVLKISLGPNGDGRFEQIGHWIRHIFSAEMRYVDRLSNRPLTDTGSVPADNIDALFVLGQQSRKDLRQFVDTISEAEWNTPLHFQMMKTMITATPKKIVTHILIHEMRHWAQIATICRLNNLSGEFRDFLFSPAMGGELRRDQKSTTSK